jgi:endonuclease-3
MTQEVNWPEAVKPLLTLYKGKKHPLHYENLYQLVVMVVLSAQDSDRHINKIAPALFTAFPDMSALADASENTLSPYISEVRNFGNKLSWLLNMAKQLQKDSNIPLTHDGLTALKGIGSKSANVILREAGKPPEGIIVDLHVVRVAPRLGIVREQKNPKKIEKQLMEQLPKNEWDAGMAMSFLGREICRPSNPKCPVCVMNKVCAYALSMPLEPIISAP